MTTSRPTRWRSPSQVRLAAQARRDDPFGLYVVDSEGPPLIHVSRTRRSEIVVFGRQQKLLPPIVLDTGSIFLNAAENDDKIELSKIVPSRFGDGDVKITTSLELAEVVRKTASLGATYPESSLSSKPPSGRRTWPVSWSSTRCPFPIGSTLKPSWARTRPPSATTLSSEPREKLPGPAGDGCSESSVEIPTAQPRTPPPTLQARMHPPSRHATSSCASTERHPVGQRLETPRPDQAQRRRC